MNDAVAPVNQPAPSPKKQRMSSFDAFKGLAIIAVVFAHATAFGWVFFDKPGEYFNAYYGVITRGFEYFALPTFVVVSGFWFGTLTFSSWADYTSFLRKRVLRILLPYLFWSILLASWQSLRGGFSVPDFAAKVLLGQADGPYYFILLMLQFYVLTPVFLRMSRTTAGLIAIIAAHVAILLGWYYVRFAFNPDLHYSVMKLPFITWLSLFPLGMWMRNHTQSVDKLTLPFLIACALVLYAVVMAESELYLRKGWLELAISDIRLTAMFYGVIVVLIFFQFRNKEWPSFLVTLGDYSFGIFFIHGTLLRGFAKIFSKVPGLFEMQPVFQSLVALATLFACYIVIYTSRRLLGVDKSSRIFGF